MRKLLIAAIAVTLSTNTLAHSSIREKGTLISNGDDLNAVYKLWGSPNFNVRSEKTCNRVIKLKKTYCSSSRKVWKRGNRFWMVQHSGSLIIKIDWTRFESNITEKM